MLKLLKLLALIISLNLSVFGGKGQYHFSVSNQQVLSKPNSFYEPNGYGNLQTYIGVSGWDEYGYGNFEIGRDWFANLSLMRFSIAFGQVITFGPEIHTSYASDSESWGWGLGPTFNYNSDLFTLTITYPFDFNTSVYQDQKPRGMVTGIEFVLRGQLPASGKRSAQR